MKQKGLVLSEYNESKGFAPILIVVMIAALVGGYLLYQNQTKPTPLPTTQLTSTPTSSPESTNSAETTNWKTYTNKDNYFSFKYPPMFTVTEKKETFESNNNNGRKMTNNQYFYSFSTGKIINGNPDFSGFLVTIFPAFGLTITQNFSFSEDDKKICTNCKITFLLPSNGADEVATYTTMSGSYRIYRVKDNFVEVGGFQDSNILPDKSDLVNLDQILSTFKFLP